MLKILILPPNFPKWGFQPISGQQLSDGKGAKKP